jgi:hypothetical protein
LIPGPRKRYEEANSRARAYSYEWIPACAGTTRERIRTWSRPKRVSVRRGAV